MTLDDAIKHCQQVADESDCECADEHRQLAEWLQELKEFKQMQTNEEWFCGLSTTEKSEFLSTMVKEAIEVHEKHGITWHEAVSWWDGWLKEKHHDK